MTVSTGRWSQLVAEMRSITGTAQNAKRELTGAELLRYEALQREREGIEAAMRGEPAPAAGAPAAQTPAPAAPRARELAIESAALAGKLPAPLPPARFMRPLDRVSAQLQSNIRYDLGRASGGRHVTICGYSALFNTPFHARGAQPRLYVRPGAFDLGGNVDLCSAHDAGRPFASTRNGSLRLWQDHLGLAMQASIARNQAGEDLLLAIGLGRACGLSVNFLAGRTCHVDTIEGERVEVVSRTRLDEISVCGEPLCPGAACWIAGVPAASLPPEARKLASNWLQSARAHAGAN